MNSPDDVFSLIRSRRTVKPLKFSDQVIEQSVIEQLLEAAHCAPTHGRTQPWRFSVYAGEAKEQLSDFLPKLYEQTTSPESFNEGKLPGLRENPLRASHVLAVSMKRQQGGKIPEVEEIESVACAVQNICLLARAHGVASFWSTGLQAYSDEAAEFFGVKAPDRFLGLLYLGYPKGDWPTREIGDWRENVTWVS